MSAKARCFNDAAGVADRVIRRLGGKIVLGLPLGLGKANLIANALYQRACTDPQISLTILTALTLAIPRGGSPLERRFIGPISERLFDGYPEPAFVAALRAGDLPANIEVQEFFLPAGGWLDVAAVQQNFILSNYTHVTRTLIERGVNVVAHMVARDGDNISLGGNADLTPDMLRAREAGRAEFLLLGEVNDNLPFMFGEAVVPSPAFECLLEGPQCNYPLFAPPKPAVAIADYAAGFHIARLIPDGGTLQIGIGSIGDAVAQALILRQLHNGVFKQTVSGLPDPAGDIGGIRRHEPMVQGLFGLSEMLVDSFLPLIDAGVVKREVGGALIQAAFFLGPKAFYERLRGMPAAERQRIHMRPVSWVNSLYQDEDSKRATRVGARFINNAMMATLLGAVISDGLEDGRVISGVGGQYDFVAQAFALEGARSIIALNATRTSGGRVRSNILWAYGNQTIPRHLRDVVVTEYGVADLRGKTDAEVIAAMLAITDSRFQPDLLEQAKRAGKIDSAYRIPTRYRDNTPAKIAAMLSPARDAGHLPTFPFGSDFTVTEQRLLPALARLRQASSSGLRMAGMVARGMTINPGRHADCLQRLGLSGSRTLRDRLYRYAVLCALADTGNRRSG